MNANDAQRLLDAYLTAAYRVRFPRTWVRVTPGVRAIALERRLARHAVFTLLTAWNPRSRPTPLRANLARQRRLAGLLRGCTTLPAEGAAPDRTWNEPSLLVAGLPTTGVDRLACRFAQHAVLHWRRGEPVALRLYGRGWPHLSTIMDAAHIRWVACRPPR